MAESRALFCRRGAIDPADSGGPCENRKARWCRADAGAGRLQVPDEKNVEILALDDALVSLEKLAPEQGRVVELRFFGGLTAEETAAVMGVSRSSVNRDWVTARAWLIRELKRNAARD